MSDSDYTSEVNFPLFNHHNNIPLHQLGTRKPHCLPSHNNHGQELFPRADNYNPTDLNHNGSYLADGEYNPNENYNGFGRRDDSFDLEGGDYQFNKRDQRNPGNLPDDIEDSSVINGYEPTPHYPPNISHNHWQQNGYQYQELPDHGSEYMYDERPERPTPSHRSSTPADSHNNSPIPAARAPIPKPRRSVNNSDREESSPYFERRSDTSEPMYYNSRPG